MYQSFIILNHNRAEFIDRAIRSCLGQLFFRKEFEIIVVDDNSTDNSLDVISEIKNKRKMGVGFCSNQALKISRGEYWMRVDSDDFLNSMAGPFTSMILDENKNISFVYNDYYKVDMKGAKIERIRLDNDETRFEYGAGVNFRTSILKKNGGYNSKLKNCEDYDLLIRLHLKKIKGYYLPIPLYRYYIHGKNITLNKERQKIKEQLKKTYGI